MKRPEPNECAEYYYGYITKVPDGDIFAHMDAQVAAFADMLASVPADREAYRYEDGKWSIREVVGHLIDTERMFTIRALAFSRDDKTHWPGFEQDDYVAASNFDSRALADLGEEYFAQRKSLTSMFRSFDESILSKQGIASERPFTVRSILWIISGHLDHHMGVLKDRYL